MQKCEVLSDPVQLLYFSLYCLKSLLADSCGRLNSVFQLRRNAFGAFNFDATRPLVDSTAFRHRGSVMVQPIVRMPRMKPTVPVSNMHGKTAVAQIPEYLLMQASRYALG